MNTPNHKFTFRYQYDGCDQIAPVDITFEIPADVTLTQLLSQIESFLRASSFYFDGELQIVKENDFENSYGLNDINSSLEEDEWDKICRETEEENLKKLKDWNEGIAKLDKEVKKNKWVHGMCNPPSPDWKKSNE